MCVKPYLVEFVIYKLRGGVSATDASVSYVSFRS